MPNNNSDVKFSNKISLNIILSFILKENDDCTLEKKNKTA